MSKVEGPWGPLGILPIGTGMAGDKAESIEKKHSGQQADAEKHREYFLLTASARLGAGLPRGEVGCLSRASHFTGSLDRQEVDR